MFSVISAGNLWTRSAGATPAGRPIINAALDTAVRHVARHGIDTVPYIDGLLRQPKPEEMTCRWVLRWPLDGPGSRQTGLPNRQSGGQRLVRELRGASPRISIAFCIGIAVTLAWQCYGDTAREIIASRYPQLAWLAPQTPVALLAPATIVPPITSPDPQDLKTISLGLAAVRQRVDQLAASQDQINREITTKLQAAKQEILDKISWPAPQLATTPVRKSVSASQPSPVH